MKESKFTPVVKVKKRQLDAAELNLSLARQKKAEFEMKFSEAQSELETLDLPQSGSANELKFSLNYRLIAKENLEKLREKIALCEKEVAHFQFLYKKANLDYEKMKALESEEIQKYQKELAKAEQKFLDEIAITRFFAQN